MRARSCGPKVLVFDSGVGGLSIARSIGARLADWQLIYLADNAYFPYGEQPDSLIIERCLELIAAVAEAHAADLIVIGCNTASTVVLPALRERFRCPVIGVVPAIKPAAFASRNRRIGLLATAATIRRPYLDGLIGEFAADCKITRVGSSELVRLAEQWLDTGTLRSEDLVRILRPLLEADVDTVVLGCTHFPLIRPLLEPLLGPQVCWVDSGDAIARRSESLWLAQSHRGLAVEGVDDAIPPHLYFTGEEPAGVRAYLAREGWQAPSIVSRFAMAG